MSRDCVFCRIIAGELPCARVYEDQDTLAILDIAPVVKGHTLVIPKRHSSRITDTPDDVLARLIAAARRVVRAQARALQADGANVTQANGAVAGQIVPHIHFHVIPRSEARGDRGKWTGGSYASPEEMRQTAESLRAAMED